MYFAALILSLFVLVSGCKTENVEFSEAENTPFTPPENGTGDGDIEPVPQAPVVEFTRKPKNHLLGDYTTFGFEVIEGDYEVDKVSCKVDRVPFPCSLAQFLFTLDGFDLGVHDVKIKAVDVKGLVGSDSAEWIISDRFNSTTQQVVVDDGGNQADILFVIDNSGSMAEEQQEVARRISRFFSKIRRLDWRVGIITTDPYEFNPNSGFPNLVGDGALIRFPNRHFFLDSTMNMSDVRDNFARTIFRSEEGHAHERGIRNTWRAVERSLSPGASEVNSRLNSFFREKASFSVVLISDENETTENSQGDLLGEQRKSRARNLVDYIRNVWGPQKQFQFNSVIVRPGDQACIKNWESYGVEYARLSRMTGGVIGDICAEDYSGALNNIGAGVVNLQKVYTLKCEPQDTNGDGAIDFRIESNKSIPSYQINGDKVEFSRPLRPGQYKFFYDCITQVPN